jgi:hypothetical protein
LPLVAFDAIGSTDKIYPQAVLARPSTSLPLFTQLDRSCIYAVGYKIFKEQQGNKKNPLTSLRKKVRGWTKKLFIFLKFF